jgi:hypothetical protein
VTGFSLGGDNQSEKAGVDVTKSAKYQRAISALARAMAVSDQCALVRGGNRANGTVLTWGVLTPLLAKDQVAIDPL